MVKYIIIFAIIAFLIAIITIYRKEIFKYIKCKFAKKKKVPEKKEKTEKKHDPKVEDFIPVVRNYDEAERDSSIQQLFVEEEFPVEINEVEEPIIQENHSNNTFNNFDDFDSIFGSRIKNNLDKKKTISQQIKELPPELKALLIDNVLKRKDDI